MILTSLGRLLLVEHLENILGVHPIILVLGVLVGTIRVNIVDVTDETNFLVLRAVEHSKPIVFFVFLKLVTDILSSSLAHNCRGSILPFLFVVRNLHVVQSEKKNEKSTDNFATAVWPSTPPLGYYYSKIVTSS